MFSHRFFRLACIVLITVGLPQTALGQPQFQISGLLLSVDNPGDLANACGVGCTASVGDLIAVNIYIDPATPDLSPLEFGLYSLRAGTNRLEILFAGKTWSSANAQGSPSFNPNALFYVHNDSCCWPGIGSYDGISIEGHVATSPTTDPDKTVYLSGRLRGVNTIFSNKLIPSVLPPLSTFAPNDGNLTRGFTILGPTAFRATGEFIDAPPGEILVTIDIKPGSDPNSINLSSAGVIPVAILSSGSFDAATVMPDTIFLASAPVKLAGKSAKYNCHLEDVNSDILLDLVCQVETAQFMIEPGASTAELTGKTTTGEQVRGSDAINIVP